MVVRSDPSGSFYRTKEWQSFRAAILRIRSKCQVEGCKDDAKHVDHKIAISKGGAKLDPDNVQALCPHHHSVKTAKYDGGFGNKAKPGERLVVLGADADGWPVDPNHHWNKGRK